MTALAGVAAGMLGSGAGLGVLEEAMRAALAAAGARLLEAVLGGGEDGYGGPHAKCASGHQAVFAGAGPRSSPRCWGRCR